MKKITLEDRKSKKTRHKGLASLLKTLVQIPKDFLLTIKREKKLPKLIVFTFAVLVVSGLLVFFFERAVKCSEMLFLFGNFAINLDTLI